MKGKLSDTKPVLSAVPQGSVLGPLPFLVFINDLDSEIISKLSKFADDTKLCNLATSEVDRDRLRLDLSKIFEWSKEWQMLFNVDKCSVLHLGKNNPNFNYYMGSNEIKSVDKEKDLGIIID